MACSRFSAAAPGGLVEIGWAMAEAKPAVMSRSWIDFTNNPGLTVLAFRAIEKVAVERD
jgi:hypothetical protein